MAMLIKFGREDMWIVMDVLYDGILTCGDEMACRHCNLKKSKRIHSQKFSLGLEIQIFIIWESKLSF